MAVFIEEDWLTAGLHLAVLQMLVLREFFYEEAALNAVICWIEIVFV